MKMRMKKIAKVLLVSYVFFLTCSFVMVGCTPAQQYETTQRTVNITDPNSKVISTINTITDTAERAEKVVDALPIPNTIKAPIADVIDIIALISALAGGAAAGVFKVAQKKTEAAKAESDTALKETVVGIQGAKTAMLAAGMDKTIMTNALAVAQQTKTTLAKVKELKATIV